MQFVLEKDARLRKVLPKRHIPDMVWAITGEDAPRRQDPNEAEGLTAQLSYESVQRDGGLDTRLAIAGKSINVERHTYSTWTNTSQVVNQVLGDISSSLHRVPTNSVTELSLAYEDVFFWEGDDRPNVAPLLRRGSKSAMSTTTHSSPAAPDWIFNAQHEWHVDQGWHAPREDLHSGARCIERLALHAVEGKIKDRDRFCVGIITTIRWLAPSDGAGSGWSFQRMFAPTTDPNKLDRTAKSLFDDMHTRAKHAFTAVLTEDALHGVGLKPEDTD